MKTASLGNDLLKDENIERPKKRVKIALLNKAIFKVKFNFKVENCALHVYVQQFLGWNIWQISTRPFFLHFAAKLKRKIKICLFRPRQIYLEYLGAIKMRDKDEISIWNIWMWIKWETKFRNSYGPLSIGLNQYIAIVQWLKLIIILCFWPARALRDGIKNSEQCRCF